jgi:hypothetical protein
MNGVQRRIGFEGSPEFYVEQDRKKVHFLRVFQNGGVFVRGDKLPEL